MSSIALVSIAFGVLLCIWFVRRRPVGPCEQSQPLAKTGIPSRSWDLLYGTLLIATIPMFVFMICGWLIMTGLKTKWPGPPQGSATFVEAAAHIVGSLLVPSVGIAALIGVIVFRKRHRVLSIRLLPLEIVLGILFGLVYFAALVIFSGFAALE